MLKELYSAVEQFYVKGGLGGLRQLTVPSRNDGECCRSSTEFLEHVTKFCPNIEYLDGAEETFHGHYGVRCDDKWMISLETREEFNKTCTKLREFHWSSVPFADPFFRVFGKYPKPQLKKLTITANLLWSWSEYFKECDETTKKAIKHCHAKYAREIDAVFKGCPGLTSLMVEIDLQKYATSATQHFTIERFGDKFWESVATHCPLLQKFAVRNCSNFGMKDVELISTFTDTALLKLADLKYLESTESNVPVMCTGDGIFEYMRRVLTTNRSAGKELELDLRLGGEDDDDDPRFYSVALELLRRLAAISEEDFGAAARSQKWFEVYLVNPYRTRMSKQWSSSYMRDELRPLMERVKKMHPSLRCSASMTGKNGDGFGKFDMLIFNWGSDHFNDMFSYTVDEGDPYDDDPYDDFLLSRTNLLSVLFE